MYRSISFIEVHDTVLFSVGGSVRRWHERVSSNLYRNVYARVPVSVRPNTSHGESPGKLKRSTRLITSRPGTRLLDGQVSVSAPYVFYVLYGTDTIYAIDRPMILPDNSSVNPFWGGPKKGFVSGQAANNFMLDGYNATARTHQSLHHISSPF